MEDPTPECGVRTVGVAENGAGIPNGAAPHAVLPSSDRFSKGKGKRRRVLHFFTVLRIYCNCN
jgi:hypothetical protein